MSLPSFWDVFMIYVFMGFVMWGSGAADIQQAGPIADYVSGFDDEGDVITDNSSTRPVQNATGGLQDAASLFLGGAFVIMDVILGVISVLFFPVTTAINYNLPVEFQVGLLVFPVAMIGGALSVIRPSFRR